MPVEVVAALPAGANAIGKLAANSGVTIGAVEIAAAQTLATVTTVGTVSALGVSTTGPMKKEDVASADGDAGIPAMAVQKATPANTAGTDGDYEFLQMSGGRLWVDASGVTLTVGSHAVTNAGTFAVQATVAAGATNIAKAEDVASADADVGVPSMAVRKGTPANTSGTDGDYEFLQMSAGRLWTSATIDAALPAGTNGIGKLTANSGVTIGAVEIAAAQTLATVTTVSTVSTLTGGGVAHDGADSGNPVKVGWKAETSPKGITLVADGDRTDAYADADGLLMIKSNTSGADAISERVSNTDGNSTAFTNFSAVASTKNYITGYHVYRTDAGTSPIYVDFRDGTAGSILWSAVIPAGGGANSPAVEGPCLFHTSANTALAYDVSAATTTVYISVAGYQSKV